MNAVVTLARKDLKLLFRNKPSLFWIFVFPLLLALLFGSIFGGGGQTRALDVAVVDEDDSAGSRALIDRLKATEAVNIEALPRDRAEDAVRLGRKVAFLVIPKGYGETAGRFGAPSAGP